MKYYSVIKKNAFESILMRWMNLKLIHSEASQREKDKYFILMQHMESRKIVLMNLPARTDLWTQ